MAGPYWRQRDIGFSGPTFPFKLGADGAFKMSQAYPATGYSKLIRESLAQLFLTARGERFFNRGFGGAPIHLLFELNDRSTFYIWAAEVTDLTKTWEPRVNMRELHLLDRDPEQGMAAIAARFNMVTSQTDEWVPLVIRG